MSIFKLNHRDEEGNLLEEIYTSDEEYCIMRCDLSSFNSRFDYEIIKVDEDFITDFMNETNKRLKRIEEAFRTFSSLDEGE